MQETLHKQMDGVELEKLIQSALDKVGGSKESDLCRYIPGESGGYLHHFTLKKLKTKNPSLLQELIGQHILQRAEPNTLAPKPRMPRGSRRRRDGMVLDHEQAERVIKLLRETGHSDLLAGIVPLKSLAQIRRELLQSIRRGRVEPHLWDLYVEASEQSENQ